MRKIIILIVFVIIIFSINLVFYFVSEDYRTFLKNIKEPNIDIILNEKIVPDKIIEKLNINDDIELHSNIELISAPEIISEKIELKSEIVLWKQYLDIIELFSIFNIKKLEINSNLFDLTDEYPDKYLEYYSKDLTLYFFTTKNYSWLNDIFSILSTELPFTIKEINNFWDNSFYINLDKDIEDRFIRLVISNKWIVFWLKIKKTEYDLVKNKLNSLKNIQQ